MSIVSPRRTDRRTFSGAVVPALIETILSKQRLYGDGPPMWPDAPSSNDAYKARERATKRLRRFSSQFPETKNPAKVLAHCRPRRRCMSGACPECGRGLQRVFVAEVRKLAKGDGGRELVSISIAFPKHRVSEDQLTTLDTTSIKRVLYETVRAADGLAWMAGGIDLSLNDDTAKGGGVYWQPQFFGFAAVTDPGALAKVLRDRFAATKAMLRPVQIKSCDGSTKAISYALKPEFVRRIAYRTEVGPPGDRRKCWTTRKVSLRPREHVRAMLWMHKVGLGGRMFLHGLRMTRTGDSVGLVKIRKRE